MKKILVKISLVFLLVSSLGASCEKEVPTVSICGVENPLINLQWLKDLKDNLEKNSDVVTAEIILYRLDDSDYVLVKKAKSFSYDYPNTIFDCEGNEKYKCGGNQPVDSCTTFFFKAQKIETIWHKN